MKKTITYTVIILLLTIITVSGTYAYLTAATNSNEIASNASKFEVIYTGGTHIDGTLPLAKNKEGGYNTTVNISVSTGSVEGKANLYIDIEKITTSIETFPKALTWEVYKTVNGTTEFVKDGTFADCKNEDGTKKICEPYDKLYIVEGYKISTDNTAFTVYVWLNGDKVNNEVFGAELKAYIAAETENVTANLE